jgi:hypothetical protein
MTVNARRDRRLVESAGVVAWRRRRLLDTGFDGITSEVFAREVSVDLHELIQLVERGCPPDLAARIMAPLDAEASTR